MKIFKSITKIIKIPYNLNIIKDNSFIIIFNSKNSVSFKIYKTINIAVDKKILLLTVKDRYKNFKHSICMLCTIHTIIKNFFIGLTTGFNKILELKGVGYKFEVVENILKINLGYSHIIKYNIPLNLKMIIKNPNTLIINGYCKQQVGNVAAFIKKKKPADIYKGKGIKYSDEKLTLKEVKKK